MHRNSGIMRCWPARNWRWIRLMPCAWLGSWKADLPVVRSRRETWICPLCPGYLPDHLAMKVAIRPLRWASTFMKVLNSAPLSPAASAWS
ncbi:hypothetical protein D3C80_1965920 [compost metagenome]